MTSIGFADMVVESEGSGDAVLLLHGLGATSNSFQPLVPALSGFRIIRPDLPGAGRSPVPQGPLDVRGIAESLIRVLAHLGIERAHVVGHSFGTLIAQHLAALRPGLVTSLALFGPIVAPGDGMRERLRARAQLARDKGMCTIADQVTPVALAAGSATSNPVAYAFVRESHMRQNSEGFARNCEALASAEAAGLERLDCPVMVVTGDEDGVGPPSVAHEIAAQVPGTQVKILSGCGHWTPVEKPADCARLLSGFLRGGR